MTDVDALFKSYSISDVHVKLEQVREEADAADLKFTQELRSRYHELLTVTSEVHNALAQLRVLEQRLRDLCFAEGVGTLAVTTEVSSRIANLDIGNATTLQEALVRNTSSRPQKNSYTTTGELPSRSSLLLLCSSWIQAAHEFERSSTVGPLVQFTYELDTKFSELPEQYRETLTGKMHALLCALVAPESTLASRLSLIQWVQLYNLIENSSNIPWESETVDKFLDKCLEMVLREDLHELQAETRELTESQRFRSKLLQILQTEIQNGLESLHSVVASPSRPQLRFDGDVQALISNSIDYANGITGEYQRQCQYQATRILDQLSLARDFKCELQTLREPVMAIIEYLKSCSESQNPSIQDPVQSFVAEFQIKEFTRLMSSYIRQFEAFFV